MARGMLINNNEYVEADMKILVINDNKSILDELKEFSTDIKAESYFADNPESAIVMLDTYSFDIIVLKLKSIPDFSILKYINDYHQKAKVVITADRGLDDVISIIQKGNYSFWHEPLRLTELKSYCAV